MELMAFVILTLWGMAFWIISGLKGIVKNQ
jgi:hypothetical protein